MGCSWVDRVIPFLERLTNFGEDVEIAFNYTCFVDVVVAIFIETHTSSSFLGREEVQDTSVLKSYLGHRVYLALSGSKRLCQSLDSHLKPLG